MIRPDGFRAAVFGTATDGDARRDGAARARLAQALGISDAWATVHQVHGAAALTASAPGPHGDGDALFSTTRMLPIAVGTADCLPIIIEGRSSVAVVHAGWRGLAAGIIESTLDTMRGAGDEPLRAAVGPGIGPCCYEVGADVTVRFPGFVAETTWGTPSIDLAAIAAARLESLEMWISPRCTKTDPDLFSHREDGTEQRQVAVAWVPAS